MAVTTIVLNPTNATEFDITHRNLYQLRCREAKEVCSVSCGKPDSSRPGHDRVLSSLRVKDLTVGSRGTLRSGPRRKPAYSRELLSRAGFAGRLFSEAERSRQVSHLEPHQGSEKASFEIFEEQLGNFCFKFIYPEEYERLSLRLLELYDKGVIIDAMKKLERALQEKMVAYHFIYGRQKCLSSIYRKMLRKNLSLDQIHDLHGVRLILETKGDCYLALEIINELWPRAVKFKDYITNPKPNGYQSLHCVVMTDENIPLEIQVRTREMHSQAEFGLSAHWRYKQEQASMKIV
ncbi:hypothetical protein FCM35_KLT12169 [Carex littledalei]|uniref:RelA/SpoT domain-containing protein n=1 Tax=Carex littledalei TaxID=544730 RepID=A0A833QPQ4_9POAL|nr:hypothetical protein FCM35_KLT12169 [Carex littledalei]